MLATRTTRQPAAMGDQAAEDRELLEALEAIEAFEALEAVEKMEVDLPNAEDRDLVEALEAIEAMEAMEEEERHLKASAGTSSQDPPLPIDSSVQGQTTPAAQDGLVTPAKNLKRLSREARMLEVDTVAGVAAMAAATPQSSGGSASRPKRDSPAKSSSARGAGSRRASAGTTGEAPQPHAQHPQAPAPSAEGTASGKSLAALERATQPQPGAAEAPSPQTALKKASPPKTAGPKDDRSAPLRCAPLLPPVRTG